MQEIELNFKWKKKKNTENFVFESLWHVIFGKALVCIKASNFWRSESCLWRVTSRIQLSSLHHLSSCKAQAETLVSNGKRERGSFFGHSDLQRSLDLWCILKCMLSRYVFRSQKANNLNISHSLETALIKTLLLWLLWTAQSANASNFPITVTARCEELIEKEKAAAAPCSL